MCFLRSPFSLLYRLFYGRTAAVDYQHNPNRLSAHTERVRFDQPDDVKEEQNVLFSGVSRHRKGTRGFFNLETTGLDYRHNPNRLSAHTQRVVFDQPGDMTAEESTLFSGAPCHHKETMVFFDLETTGLDTSACDIVQLSAICGKRLFNVYMFPRCPIHHQASKVTGLTTCDKDLLLHEQPVETVQVHEALKSFISYLRTVSNPVLVAHNCKRFDCPILLRILEEFHLLDEFRDVVSGFLDTLLLSREMFKLPKYNQSYLVEHFLHKTYGAHNATEDVRALQELYRAWAPSFDLVKKHKFFSQL